MALIKMNFHSDVLRMAMEMDVIFPQLSYTAKKKDKFQVLYLLHGMSDDNTIWQRRTSIERYVQDGNYNLLVVMPNAHRGFYTNMATGEDYWTYISKEIPAIIEANFKVSTKREDTFAAGLSMGGYGAMKLVLGLPHKFAAGATLSGALDPERFANTFKDNPQPFVYNEFKRIFGRIDKIPGSSNDLFHLARKLSLGGKEKPAIFQCCGTEDFLYGDNIKFRDFIKKQKFNFKYTEGPGNHSWEYWDDNIQKVLKWLPLKKIN